MNLAPFSATEKAKHPTKLGQSTKHPTPLVPPTVRAKHQPPFRSIQRSPPTEQQPAVSTLSPPDKPPTPTAPYG